MAVTSTTNRANDVQGNLRVTDTVLSLDNSYTTGGYVLQPKLLGLSSVAFGVATPQTVVTAGPGDSILLPQSNGTVLLKLIAPSGTAEVAAGATLTGAQVKVTAWGN